MPPLCLEPAGFVLSLLGLEPIEVNLPSVMAPSEPESVEVDEPELGLTEVKGAVLLAPEECGEEQDKTAQVPQAWNGLPAGKNGQDDRWGGREGRQ